MNIFQAFRSPQQFIQGMMADSRVMQNPMAKNAISMMQNGDAQGIEQMARNLCEAKGMNPDEVMNQIKSKFNM